MPSWQQPPTSPVVWWLFDKLGWDRAARSASVTSSTAFDGASNDDRAPSVSSYCSGEYDDGYNEATLGLCYPAVPSYPSSDRSTGFPQCLSTPLPDSAFTHKPVSAATSKPARTVLAPISADDNDLFYLPAGVVGHAMRADASVFTSARQSAIPSTGVCKPIARPAAPAPASHTSLSTAFTSTDSTSTGAMGIPFGVRSQELRHGDRDYASEMPSLLAGYPSARATAVDVSATDAVQSVTPADAHAGGPTNGRMPSAADGLDEPSLCIPWMSADVKRETVIATFEQFGRVRQVDLVPRDDHVLCFVHFIRWDISNPNTNLVRVRPCLVLPSP